MKTPKSLVNVLWMGLTLMYLIVTGILVYLWVGQEIRSRETEFSQIRETYIAGRKKEIKNQILQAAHYIEHKKSLTEKRVREEVRSRTREAWEIAHHIWQQHQQTHSKKAIQVLIHDALFAATWDEGRGYYFVEDLTGNEIINRNNPELEGKNLMHVRDSKGKLIMADFLRVAQSPAREGFSTYHWNRPDTPGVMTPKISYIKYFQPLDWVIGSGKYLTDEEEKIRREVLEYLENFRFGDDNHIFAGAFDGRVLTGPYKSDQPQDLTDVNGVKVLQELSRAARGGGGFVYYMMPRSKGKPPEFKISYAKEVKDWGWYIGAGAFISDIETVILEKQAELRANLQNLMVKSGLALLAGLLLSVFLAWQLSRRIKVNLDSFLHFFSRTAHQHQPLSDREISFSEFIPIARAANQMVRERNAYEAALRESEKKYRQLFEQTRDATLIMEDGRFTDCNQAAMDLLDIRDKNSIVGRHPAELSPPVQPDGQDSRKKADRVQAQALTAGSLRFEWLHQKADQTPIPVEVSITPIRTQKGGTVFHTVWRDITQRKQAEALMVQTEKMTTIGGLAAGMAHEINNPLAGMIQSAQVLRQRLTKNAPANEKAAARHGIALRDLEGYMEERGIFRFVDTILETGNRAAAIVQNMLNFARKKPTVKAPHHLDRILDATLELARNDYSLKKDCDIGTMEITRNYAPDLPRVFCDDNRIQQVFFNIIKNAVQAVSQEDRGETRKAALAFSVFPAGDEMVVTIRDNGPGMDEAVKKRIFEPFYTTKSVNQGTGLGLSVSYFIVVQDHGGRLEVTSEPGQGTCFTMALPLRDPV